MISTVLFDLDGTLLDTAPDFARVLDAMRAEHDRPPMQFTEFRGTVSHGATAMLTMAFPEVAADTALLERLRAEFLERYSQDLVVHTRLFDGMDSVLDELESRGILWGIVTNKPGWLTGPLLEQLGLGGRAASVVSGDSLSQRKPHPAPVLHACAEAGVAPAQAVYVGDAERDIQAGRAGGLATAVALFGYIDAADRPSEWGADALLESPGGLLDWLVPRMRERRA